MLSWSTCPRLYLHRTCVKRKFYRNICGEAWDGRASPEGPLSNGRRRLQLLNQGLPKGKMEAESSGTGATHSWRTFCTDRCDHSEEGGGLAQQLL